LQKRSNGPRAAVQLAVPERYLAAIVMPERESRALGVTVRPVLEQFDERARWAAAMF
jgi:hypothetical protein